MSHYNIYKQAMVTDGHNVKDFGNCKVVVFYNNVQLKHNRFATSLNYVRLIFILMLRVLV